MKTFVVVPAFNEGKRIYQFLKELKKSELPVIAVDDGSSDKTWNELEKAQSHNSKLLVLRHKINLGKGAAMKTGAEASFLKGADSIVFMDGDGQHATSDIPKFLSGLKSHDIVLGEREVSGNVSYRIYGSRMISKIANILFGVTVNDFLCGYRALTKKAYKEIKWDSSDYGVETEMIARIGKKKLNYSVVPVKSIYHDVYKGFSPMDGLKLLYNMISWKLTI